MENNLSKAISQIKRPVRYDGLDGHIYDANGHRILRTLIEGLLTIERADVVGHALAEMINGLDGRGNDFAIPTDQCISDWFENGLGEDHLEDYITNKEALKWVKSAIKYFMVTWQSKTPDRQVKSAEHFFQSNNGGKDSDTSVEHGETFTARFVIDFAESYAQQYK